ncbi:MAG: hypothetical protein RIC16_11945 [Rhodospirillales bacterium]
MNDKKDPTATIGVSYRQCDMHNAASADTRLCLDVWNRLRGERLAPAWTEFDWTAIPSAIIPHMGVVDVRTDPLDFIYRFWGSAHVSAHNQELTGKSVHEMRPAEEGRSVFAQYRETMIAREPRLYINTIHATGSNTILTETSLRLPFSADGENIHQIMAFSDIRESHTGVRQLFEELARKNAPPES